MISEKKSLQDSTKAVYDKYKSQIPYEIDFVPFAGHVVGLVMPEEYNPSWKSWNLQDLPIIPDKFRYKAARDKARYYKEAADKIKNGNYDFICNNCDPGREGQLIFHAFLTTLKGKIPPLKRMWALDPTEESVKDALINMRDESEPSLKGMTDASFLRSYMDWLVGMNFSRAVTITSGQKVNLGRVMTPTLNIVVQRELELRNFKPKDFWQLEADFGKYQGIYFDETGTVSFYDKKDADKAMSQVGKQGTITSVDKKTTKSYAPKLHSLFELQGEANELFGYTMNQTLAIVQSLYEKKLLSYPRTDSSYLTSALAKGFPKMLKPLLSIPYLKNEVEAVLNNPALQKEVAGNKSYVDDKKVSDHYAITPTGIVPDFAKLTQDEKNIYETVAKRFLAIFLPPEITDRTTIVTESNGLSFRTTGKIIKDPGYTRIYNKNSKDVILPNVSKGDVYDVVGVHLNQGKTKPPPRYNDKTLGSIMENVARLVEDDEMKLILKEKKGLGTPATRGSIVEKLVTLKMIERKKKNFYATDYGISIIQSLQGQDIIQAELTATWEAKLADIEKGSLNKQTFYQEMLNYIHEETEKLTNMKTAIVGGAARGGKGGNAPKEIGTCPACGGKVLETKNYFRCEHYKDSCDFILGKTFFNAKLTGTEVKKLLSGKPTKELEMSNDKKQWKAQLVYDSTQKKVVFASSKSGGSNSSSSSTSDSKPIGTCPTCGGNVKETDRFFLCENYKDKCKTCIPKSVNGVKLTKTDAKKLLKGDWLEPKEFTWKSGKKSKAKIRFHEKIEYDFSN